VWARHRRVAQSASALLVRGTLEVAHGVINVMAERIEALPLAAALRARDFC
jgi:error-prone DNA polymerase